MQHPLASNKKDNINYELIKCNVDKRIADSCSSIEKPVCNKITDRYWYGSYKEITLVVDKETGSFNATKLCRLKGKLFSNWRKNKKSNELIAQLQNIVGGDVCYEIKGDNRNAIVNQISGTYLHKYLLTSFTLWLSVDLFYKCTIILENLLIHRNTLQDTHLNQLHNLQIQMEKNETDIKKALDEGFNRIVATIRNKPTHKKKKTDKDYQILFIQKKHNQEERFRYYSVYVQEDVFLKKEEYIRDNYPHIRIIIPSKNIQDEQIRIFESSGLTVSEINQFNTRCKNEEEFLYILEDNF